MLERALNRANRWVLDHVGPQWVDYVVSNTMTDLNRRVNDFLWTYDLKAQIEQVLDEAPGVRTYVLRPNQHWQGMIPGQHIEVALVVGGQPLRRCYSVSPRANGRVSITVKRQDGGLASPWIHEHWRAGTNLTLGQARGQFIYREQPKVLFLCAGSGITPCHAMVTSLLGRPDGERPDVQVIAQFRSMGEVIFREDLQAWARAGVQVSTAISGDPAAPVGRLDLAQLRRLSEDVTERDIYLCGPTGFMARMIEHLQDLGVDPARIHTERFVAVAVAPAPGAAPEDFQVEGAEVYFENIGAHLTLTSADQGKTLLQVARDHGLHLESGCCQGMCGTCKLTLHEGQVSGNVLGRAVYLCTAYPASREVVLGG